MCGYIILTTFIILTCTISCSELCQCVPEAKCGHQTAVHYRYTNNCFNHEDICCEEYYIIADKDEKSDEYVHKHEICGTSNPNGITEYHIEDEDYYSKYGEFTWTIGIYRIQSGPYEEQINIYLNGGSLIHPSIVLTSAQAILNIPAEKIMARAGDYDRTHVNEPYPHQDRFVSKLVIHENFRNPALANNIALLILYNPFDLTINVGLALLPPPNYNSDNQTCIMTGWGKISIPGIRSWATTLKKVTLTTITAEKCELLLRRAFKNTIYNLHESIICAGGEANVDSCVGDGGSALVCRVPDTANKFYQVGVVSFGVGECGQQHVPGMYTKVSNFREWINRTMIENNFYNFCLE